MPFLGETGGVGHGDQPGSQAVRTLAPRRLRPDLPQDVARRAADARRQAEEHVDHDAPRAASRTHAAVTAERRVPAVGGTRTVPEPDAIAIDHLLLGLRTDQHVPGLVDAYHGPASLKAQVELEAKRAHGAA